MKAIISIFLLSFFLSAPWNSLAAPSGSDLLTACKNSVNTGFDSIQGQMCTWYVLPCNCSDEITLPEVCAPENLETQELAMIVVEGLEGNNDLLNESAGYSAAVILSRKFPCNKNINSQPDN